ncbi:hypothetical protein V8B97DRAFT_1874102 [Scleroderma yunnanense]
MAATACRTAVYYGPVINPESLTCFQALSQCLIAVGPDGNILWIETDIAKCNLEATLEERGLCHDNHMLVVLKPGEFIMPGFVDSHIHACQIPNLGLGGDDQLLDWLKNTVFPTEARFKDTEYATRAYPDIVNRVINSGTTTACYYGSLHLEATKILANIIHAKGQRAFVGKCNMDRNDDYPCYVEPCAAESMETMKCLIAHIQGLSCTGAGEALVHPIITPRFALSCTVDLLTRLGDFAETVPDMAIQTHIAENPKEVEEVRKLFPCISSYAGVYDHFKLLRNNTILGHGVWLTDEEMKLIAARGAGVAHCPASNFFLSSGMAQVGKMLDYGVKVGLGTDVAGSNNPSMLYTIQMASTASKMVAIQSKEGEHGRFTNKRLETAALLYLATLGGADLCCLKHRIGSFKRGKAFDALLVSIRDDTGNPAVWGYNRDRDLDEGPYPQCAEKNLKEWLQRFFYCGDSRNIRRVFVQGALVGGQEFQC